MTKTTIITSVIIIIVSMILIYTSNKGHDAAMKKCIKSGNTSTDCRYIYTDYLGEKK